MFDVDEKDRSDLRPAPAAQHENARQGHPKGILHVFGSMDRGGAETRAVEIMRHVDPEVFEFHFCTLSGRSGALDREIESRAGRIHPCPLGPFFPVTFTRLLNRLRVSVVHSHVQLFSGAILGLAHRARVPVRISHLHSSRDNHGDNLRRACQRRLMRYWIDRHATDIVAVSGATMTAAWSPDWKRDPRCRVIYTAIDAEATWVDVDSGDVRGEFGIPVGSRIVIHVGSQQEAKNHCRVIQVFANIVRYNDSARLLLVGRSDPIIEQRIRQQAAQLRVLERIVFAGERNDVPRLMKVADVMVFPSIWEGLPGAVLEACAAGLPVLATDASFMHEIAAQCPNVRCLPLAAPDHAWAQAAEALADQRLRAPQGTRTAHSGPLFSMSRYAREWQDIWARQ